MRQGVTYPIVQDLVLLGGGHAHALVARAWGMDPLPGVRLTLVNPGPSAPYTGMLPGFVAGHYRRDEIMIDLVTLAERAGARLIMDRALGIDASARRVVLEQRGALAYDVLSVDIGISSAPPGLKGLAEHGISAKPLGPFAQRWDAFATAHAGRAVRVVVLGGGLGGIELALAARHRLGPKAAVTILQRGDRLLPTLPNSARRALLSALDRDGIVTRLGVVAEEVAADHLRLVGGEVLSADLVISAAGTQAQGWLTGTGLTDAEGFIAVNRYLQSRDASIFAVGDCAALESARPKAGVFAVRAAPVLHHNLRAAIIGGQLQAFRPQGDYLKLASTGRKGAVGEKWGLALSGPAAPMMWRWKDRIDRRFMAMFAPGAMGATDPAAALSASARAVPGLVEAIGPVPHCGGCAAKVGAGALGAGLAALSNPSLRRADVLRGIGDDAAVLEIGGQAQVLTTDLLRGLTRDLGLMARIAAIHALGDVWAMGAAPQAALSTVVLPPMGPGKAAEALAEILESAADVMSAEGAALVGGHSALGAELMLGFTLTGLAAGRLTGKGGAKAGDVLILTKALGSGTVMAGPMAGIPVPGLVIGEAVASAFTAMTRPMGADARILAPIAHAMTDVTGFGLAGHMGEMLDASPGLAAEIAAADLPLLPGALAMAGAGIYSSLAAQNRAAVSGRLMGPDGPHLALLVDPQTCGGLLAAVPEAAAGAALAALRKAGAPAVRIGRLVSGDGTIRLT